MKSGVGVFLSILMLWNASCAQSMGANQNGLDVPHSVNLTPNTLTAVRGAAG